MLPRSDYTRQHGDGAYSRTAILRALDAIVHANDGWSRSRVLARQPADIFGTDPRPPGNTLGRVFLHALLQFLEAKRVFADVFPVVKILIDDDVQHAQGKRHIRTRVDGQIPISAARGAGLVGIDDNQLRAVAPGFFNKRPQMDVGTVNVRAPGDDVF